LNKKLQVKFKKLNYNNQNYIKAEIITLFDIPKYNLFFLALDFFLSLTPQKPSQKKLQTNRNIQQYSD
jgi:hypothetical protein